MNFSNKIFHVHSVVRRLTFGPTGHFSNLPGIQFEPGISWFLSKTAYYLKNCFRPKHPNKQIATSTFYNKIHMEVNGTHPWISQSPEDQDKGIPIYDLATVHKYIRGWGGKRTPKEQKGAEFQDSNENKEGSDDNYTMICDCAHIMIFVALECSWYSTVYKL